MTIEVDVQDGLPSRVLYAGQEIGPAWGCETADTGGFFSFDQQVARCSLREISVGEANGWHHREVEVVLPHARFNLRHEMSIEKDQILRRQSLRTLAPSVLQDFVCRFVLWKNIFARAEISGKSFHHRNSNIWHQYPVGSATLFGDRLAVTVETLQWEGDAHFLRFAYVRDEPSGCWIVHVRLLPAREDLLWLRWDTRFGRLIDLQGRVARALLSLPPLKRRLWYMAERRGGRPQLQAQPLAVLPEGTRISMEVACRIRPL